MELVWQVVKVCGLLITCMGSGAVLGFLYARERYIKENWDHELLMNAMRRELEDRNDRA